MVYIKTSITKVLYDELKSEGKQAINDYGFEYLYNKGYIKSDKEYKGCFLHKTDDSYTIIFATQVYDN